MKSDLKWLAAVLLGVMFTVQAAQADPGGGAPDEPVLTAMLHAFLAGASSNDPAAHDRFWSEQLIYTSSAGTRFGKADIMEGLAQADDTAAVVYSAEDIRIQQYGDTAVVAFRLVGQPAGQGERLRYFNTGTFAREGGIWKAVAWQATKIPPEQGQQN